jgi:hypothetical protein
MELTHSLVDIAERKRLLDTDDPAPTGRVERGEVPVDIATVEGRDGSSDGGVVVHCDHRISCRL